MRVKITVYTLASDDDSGTSAEVFATEREAVERLVRGLQHVDADDEETIQELIAAYFEQDADFYEKIQPYKSEYDTYSIDYQTLIVEAEPLEELAGRQRKAARHGRRIKAEKELNAKGQSLTD